MTIFNIRILTIALAMASIMASCGGTKNSSGMNMVARMQVTEPIDGVCDNANIIAVLPLPGNGQVEAVPPISESKIEAELNTSVAFLSDYPDFEGKGGVNLIVNCKGEMVKCSIDNKSSSDELNQQVLAVFANLKKWKPGTIQNKPVDTVVLYSFTVKNGKISLS